MEQTIDSNSKHSCIFITINLKYCVEYSNYKRIILFAVSSIYWLTAAEIYQHLIVRYKKRCNKIYQAKALTKYSHQLVKLFFFQLQSLCYEFRNIFIVFFQYSVYTLSLLVTLYIFADKRENVNVHKSDPRLDSSVYASIGYNVVFQVSQNSLLFIYCFQHTFFNKIKKYRISQIKMFWSWDF